MQQYSDGAPQLFHRTCFGDPVTGKALFSGFCVEDMYVHSYGFTSWSSFLGSVVMGMTELVKVLRPRPIMFPHLGGCGAVVWEPALVVAGRSFIRLFKLFTHEVQ